MTERHAIAAAIAAFALLLGGCFGGDEQHARAPAATDEPSAVIGVPMVIFKPTDGVMVRATFTRSGALRATLNVAGRAQPDTDVLVSSGCAADACSDRVRSLIDGRWEAHVVVTAPGRLPRATVEAVNSADPQDTASVQVRLRGSQPPAPRTRPSPTAPPTAAKTPVPTAVPRRPGPRSLIMIGDSLAEGTEPIIPGLLPGWQVRIDADGSRPLGAGMQILSNTGLGAAPAVLAFSLFTNDDPRNVAALDSAVRTSVARAGPRGCAVWATIVRPPLNGVSYNDANRRLLQLASDPALAPHLIVVPWAAAATANPGWLASDGVHATPEGYRARAQMYADAARACRT